MSKQSKQAAKAAAQQEAEKPAVDTTEQTPSVEGQQGQDPESTSTEQSAEGAAGESLEQNTTDVKKGPDGDEEPAIPPDVDPEPKDDLGASRDIVGAQGTQGEPGAEEPAPSLKESLEAAGLSTPPEGLIDAAQAPVDTQPAAVALAAASDVNEEGRGAGIASIIQEETTPEVEKPKVTFPLLMNPKLHADFEKLSPSARLGIHRLYTYVGEMGGQVGLTEAKGASHQRTLYITLVGLLSSNFSELRSVTDILLSVVQDNLAPGKAFSPTMYSRFMNQVNMDSGDRSAFLSLVEILRILADPQSRPLVLKHMPLGAMLEKCSGRSGLTPQTRDNLIRLFA